MNSARKIARPTRESVFSGVCSFFDLQAVHLLLDDLDAFLTELVRRFISDQLLHCYNQGSYLCVEIEGEI